MLQHLFIYFCCNKRLFRPLGPPAEKALCCASIFFFISF